MKKYKYLLILATLFVFIVFNSIQISAHPGRTDSSGCHVCRTNCDSYGYAYDSVHCHNGTTAPPKASPPPSDGISSFSSNISDKEEPSSSNEFWNIIIYTFIGASFTAVLVLIKELRNSRK